jgi:hypothetical protein
VGSRNSESNKNFSVYYYLFFVFSISKRGYVQREFKLVLDTLEEIPDDEVFIIPVRLDDCQIPESFSQIHYVDLFEKGGLESVLKVISSEMRQTTLSNQFIDPRDGQVYKTVELANKKWMAENLNFNVGEGCWFYNNDPKKGEKYGRLYTWEEALKACPPGWRLPTDEEWKQLVMYFGWVSR